jgi:hypothetical protein
LTQYTVDIVGRRTDTSGDFVAIMIKSAVSKIAGVTSDVGNIYEVIIARTDNSFLADVRADNSNGSINIYVTGNIGKTISWKAAITSLEV